MYFLIFPFSLHTKKCSTDLGFFVKGQITNCCRFVGVKGNQGYYVDPSITREKNTQILIDNFQIQKLKSHIVFGIHI